MAGVSNYLENALIDWLLRGFAFSVAGGSAPAGSGIDFVYVALMTSLPTDAGGGVEVPAGGGYARVLLTSSSNNWKSTQGTMGDSSGGTSGETTTGYAVTFGSPSVDWGTVIGAALYDASTGGNMLIYGPLQESKTINSGDQPPVVSPGFLKFRLDN